ncbi:MAG: response regulator [Sandaracinaceae bacterium]|nr:response regulator [Sandaracinaceae bacterium]
MSESGALEAELVRLRRRVAELEAQLGDTPRPGSPDQTELVVRWLPDFTRTFVNDAYCRSFGRPREELLGTSFLELVAPEDRERVQSKLRRLTPESPVDVDEHRVLYPDGRTGWQQWVDRAVFDEQGRLLELQSVGRDVTDRMELEAQLRQAQRLEAVGLLAGGIAHDFNNLLLVMMTRLDLALAATEPGDPARRHLDDIGAAAERAAKLTRQLLTLTRNQSVEMEPVDLRDVVLRVLPLLRSVVREDVTVTFDRSPKPCFVRADSGRIDQVLINLSANARDAMPGGGRLVVEVAPAFVEPSGAPGVRYVQRPEPGHYVRLAVTDSGTGIDDGILERVFEPFFSRKEGSGVGLGLSSVYGIVRQHGGFVGVRNVEPHGARFEVLLPSIAEAAPVSRPSLPPASPTAVRVLLVEDDDAVRGVVRTALESQGHAVVEARDAQDVWRRVEEGGFVPDVVVSDVVMPGTHGPAIFEQLRARWPSLRAVFVSGHPGEGDRIQRLLGPRVAYLAKPFSVGDLRAALERTGVEPRSD